MVTGRDAVEFIHSFIFCFIIHKSQNNQSYTTHRNTHIGTYGFVSIHLLAAFPLGGCGSGGVGAEPGLAGAHPTLETIHTRIHTQGHSPLSLTEEGSWSSWREPRPMGEDPQTPHRKASGP